MTGHAALARANFETGCNCAQAVLCAYPELLPREMAMKLGASLGGGIGRLREVCGAVSGMLMALGLKYGYADPKDRAGKTAQYELVRALADEFKKENGIDLSGDKMAMQRLKEAAEKAKIELSGMTQANVNLPFITADATGPKHFDMNITRAKFNELTADLVEKTMGPVNQALSDAGLSPSDLNKVLLVGGSTRMLAVPNPGNDRHCSNVDYN